MSQKIVLELTEEEASLVSQACEFYARIRIGQFSEIPYYCINPSAEDYCNRRDLANEYLLMARKQIYPNLSGIGHSYGIGKFKDADKAYDVHQVLREKLHGTKPFSYDPLPVCYRKDCD